MEVQVDSEAQRGEEEAFHEADVEMAPASQPGDGDGASTSEPDAALGQAMSPQACSQPRSEDEQKSVEGGEMEEAPAVMETEKKVQPMDTEPSDTVQPIVEEKVETVVKPQEVVVEAAKEEEAKKPGPASSAEAVPEKKIEEPKRTQESEEARPAAVQLPAFKFEVTNYFEPGSSSRDEALAGCRFLSEHVSADYEAALKQRLRYYVGGECRFPGRHVELEDFCVKATDTRHCVACSKLLPFWLHERRGVDPAMQPYGLPSSLGTPNKEVEEELKKLMQKPIPPQVRRPTTPFEFFAGFYDSMFAAHKSLRGALREKMLALQWTRLSPPQRRPFELIHFFDRTRFLRELRAAHKLGLKAGVATGAPSLGPVRAQPVGKPTVVSPATTVELSQPTVKKVAKEQDFSRYLQWVGKTVLVKRETASVLAHVDSLLPGGRFRLRGVRVNGTFGSLTDEWWESPVSVARLVSLHMRKETEAETEAKAEKKKEEEKKAEKAPLKEEEEEEKKKEKVEAAKPAEEEEEEEGDSAAPTTKKRKTAVGTPVAVTRASPRLKVKPEAAVVKDEEQKKKEKEEEELEKEKELLAKVHVMKGKGASLRLFIPKALIEWPASFKREQCDECKEFDHLNRFLSCDNDECVRLWHHMGCSKSELPSLFPVGKSWRCDPETNYTRCLKDRLSRKRKR